MNNSNLNKEML